MRIGLTPRDFLGWQGGREFIALVAKALALIDSGDSIEVVDDVKDADWPRRFVRSANHRIKGIEPPHNKPYLEAEDGLGLFAKSRNKERDVYGPFLRQPAPGLKQPWLGYVPDFQHRHFPENFSKREGAAREQIARIMLQKAPAIIVNSQSVADDLLRYFPDHQRQVTVLPFAGCPEPAWFDEPSDMPIYPGTDAPYFLCSNQFWRHKNHRLVLEAIFLARTMAEPVRFLFTGETSDYRHPGYFDELKAFIAQAGIEDDVHILGLLPKTHQIALMRRAQAVVQPSLFEGGPGGGSLYNAIALGLPTIASNILVNREIAPLITHFFDPHSASDLLAKLRLPMKRAGELPDTLLQRGLERRRAFGTALRSAFAEAARGRDSK